MNLRESPANQPIPPERLAEASVWIAHLHGDRRGPAIEKGFRRWLHEDPLNARAFELATDVWNDAANLRRVMPSTATRPRSMARIGFAWAALAAVTILVFASVAFHLRGGGIATAVGEQRSLTLEDGTEIFLNTATRVVVSYDDKARRVEMQAGEAIFNVAKKPGWPFIVTAGNRRIEALGTSFVVRRDEERVAVTLVEGKVVVTSPQALAEKNKTGTASPQAPPPGVVSQVSNDVFTLAPGQRLTFTAGESAQIDTPSIDQTTAWRHGQVILDDTPLSVAAVEMNRYNSVKLVVEDPAAGDLLVNGLFQAGNSLRFANAVAQRYGLRVIEQKEKIILSGSPQH